jgi:Uma2 family endonuclease
MVPAVLRESPVWRYTTIMPIMAPATPQEVLEAIEHLPFGGARLIVHDVSWEDYERISDSFGDGGPRISFDCGRLEVVSPSNDHSRPSRLLDRLLGEFCERRGLVLEAWGDATWRKKTALKAAEADCCYYVSNADRVIGKKGFSLDKSDPPPDIVVEIDLTTDSRRKFSIYAGFGVPEVWIYDGESLRFYELIEGRYEEAPNSRNLPGLTSRLLLEAFAMADKVGQQQAIAAFRKRIHKLK